MTAKRILKLGGAAVIGFAVAGCEVTSVGVGVGYNYGYNSPFYWNDYYRHGGDVNIDVDVDNRPGRPERPDRPVRPDRPKPPIAKPPNVRPPTHKPARPNRPSRPGGGRAR